MTIVIDCVDGYLPVKGEQSTYVDSVSFRISDFRQTSLYESYEITSQLVISPYFHEAEWRIFISVSWSRGITEKQIRRGAFKSVHALVAAIMEYIDANNAEAKPLVWTASAQTILCRVKVANEVLETL